MHVTIVAKAPVAGRVKTRLCPPCTFAEAAAVAAAGLADTFDAIDRIPEIELVTRVLLLDGDAQPWMPGDYRVVPQRGDGLAERLRNGFADLGPGVITGMETPHVAHLLGAALEWLHRGVDVLGLAEDGGYWAIGLCATTIQRVDDVFAGVPMSTAVTGAVQHSRLRSVGTRLELLPYARDLDTIDDLRAVADSGRSGRLAQLAREIVERSGQNPTDQPIVGSSVRA